MTLSTIVAGLTMIVVLVVVHEFGHFVFAKLFGVGVPIFSVGMGPRLFGVRYRDTDYRFSALPIGGYVLMSGADPFGEEDVHNRVDPEIDFMKKPVWQRLIIMFAGPAFNLVLPFFVFLAVLMLGDPQLPPVFGHVVEGSAAWEAGLRPGDTITRIDDRPVEVFSDALRHIEADPDRAYQLQLERDGQPVELTLPANTMVYTATGGVDGEAVGFFSSSLSTRIGVDDPASPAWRAGLKIGDLITEVDDQPVSTWQELMVALTPNQSHRIEGLRVDPEAGRTEIDLTLEPDPTYTPREGETWGEGWGVIPSMNFIGRVQPDTAAEEAGLLYDDRIIAIDGAPVMSWTDLRGLIARSTEGRTPEQGPRQLEVQLVREGQLRTLQFAPRITRRIIGAEVRYRPEMGIASYPTSFVSPDPVQKYYGVFEAAPIALEQTRDALVGTLSALYKVVTLEFKPQEALGGPVAIALAAGQAAEAGWFTFAKLLAMISFSLGIVNLLPLPVLDGGQILFYSIEGLRGRPLSIDLREKVQMVGVLALAALMLMVTVMDVHRWTTAEEPESDAPVPVSADP